MLEAVFLSTRVLVMTPRPGTIGAVIDVPLPYPRSPELRFAPEFIEIVREVSGVMRGFSVEARVMSVEADASWKTPTIDRGAARGGRRAPEPSQAASLASGVVAAAARGRGTRRSAPGTSRTYVLLDAQRRFLLPPPRRGRPAEHLRRRRPSARSSTATWKTARVAVVGLAIASVLGIAIAVAMSQARWVERSLFPWAVVLQTVPILAIVPLIGFWWGFDFRSRVLVCVLISLFPMITNTLFGLRSAPAGAARPLLAAAGEPLDAAAEARVPGRAAGHLRRPAGSLPGSR